MRISAHAISKAIAVSAALLLVAASSRDVQGADDADVLQEASGSDVTFYTGTTPSQPGRFEGRVVCLRTDRGFAAEAADGCQEGARVLALSMNGGDLVQPVLTMTPEAQKALESHVDEEVVIVGKHYASIGMILASGVTSEGKGGSELY